MKTLASSASHGTLAPLGKHYNTRALSWNWPTSRESLIDPSRVTQVILHVHCGAVAHQAISNVEIASIVVALISVTCTVCLTFFEVLIRHSIQRDGLPTVMTCMAQTVFVAKFCSRLSSKERLGYSVIRNIGTGMIAGASSEQMTIQMTPYCLDVGCWPAGFL